MVDAVEFAAVGAVDFGVAVVGSADGKRHDEVFVGIDEVFVGILRRWV